jgi:hypothetical protein
MKWKCGNQSQPERGGKRIAAWPAILFAPPLSTRFYAINFVYIPELQWQFGHPWLSVRWSSLAASSTYSSKPDAGFETLTGRRRTATALLGPDPKSDPALLEGFNHRGFEQRADRHRRPRPDRGPLRI